MPAVASFDQWLSKDPAVTQKGYIRMQQHTHSVKREDQRGFTIVELMIVVAVLGIIAGIAIPGYVQGRVAANESAVIGTLRAMATGQFKFKTMSLVDVDRNGGYEFGTVREMTGSTTLRGSTSERLSPNLLPMSLDGLDTEGRFLKHGYYFQLSLPDAAGNGLPETEANLANIDPTNSERYWTMVAWPVMRSQSGRATFFVNQQGEMVKTTEGGYSGTTVVPAPGAALLGTADPQIITANEIAIGVAAADGNVWTPVR